MQGAPYSTAPPSSASSPAGAENKLPLKMQMRPHFCFAYEDSQKQGCLVIAAAAVRHGGWGKDQPAPALPNTYAASSGSAPGKVGRESPAPCLLPQPLGLASSLTFPKRVMGRQEGELPERGYAGLSLPSQPSQLPGVDWGRRGSNSQHKDATHPVWLVLRKPVMQLCF